MSKTRAHGHTSGSQPGHHAWVSANILQGGRREWPIMECRKLQVSVAKQGFESFSSQLHRRKIKCPNVAYFNIFHLVDPFNYHFLWAAILTLRAASGRQWSLRTVCWKPHMWRPAPCWRVCLGFGDIWSLGAEEKAVDFRWIHHVIQYHFISPLDNP